MRTLLWTCPACGRQFAHRNQWHSCGRFTVEQYLRGKDPLAVALYRRFAEMVRACGPVDIDPVKTRIGFKVRMIFAAVTLKGTALTGHLVLARRRENQRFTRVLSPSPRNHVHEFRFESLDELDEEVAGWLSEAYAVGCQLHLDA